MSREVPRSVVDRPRLVARLDEGTRERLTLVTGPSGAGKSVVLRQWAAARTGVPWVRLDAGVVDGVRLGRQLVEAVVQHHPGFGVEALRHLQLGGTQMGAPFVEALRHELAALPPTVIVLEDLHEAPPVLAEELGQIVTRGAGQVRLLVSSRVRPPMAMSRLRAQGRLMEILAPELAFTLAEAGEAVARVAGIRLEPEQLRRLHDRTEGWVLGVRLAALAMRGGDVDAVLHPSGGLVREATAFLADEVVAQEAADVRAFLRQTSVLDRLDPDLCDVLLDRTDSRRALLDLERRNLFVVGLDDRRGSYRYHPLFARLLRDQLAVEDPTQTARQLVRAAHWHLERDERGIAVEYLLRAERWDQALEVAAAGAWDSYARGEATTAIRWLESVPVDVRRADVRAETMLIGLHRLIGNHLVADQLLDEREPSPVPGDRDDVSGHVLSAGGVLGGRDPADALAHAEAALAGLAAAPPGGDHGSGWRAPPGQVSDLDLQAAARLAGGRALHLLGRSDTARRWLEAAAALSPTSPAYHLRGLAALAHLEADVGRLEASYAPARRAQKYAEEVQLHDATPLGETHLALGRVSYERDELVAASEHLREADVLVRANRSSVLVALVAAARAEVALAEGAPQGGLDLVARWRGEAGGAVPAGVAARLAEVEVRLLLGVGERDRARAVLAGAPPTADMTPVVARLAAAEGDLPALALVVGRWPAGSGVRARIQHRLWRALLAERNGDAAGASAAVLAAVRLADVDGHRRAFLDCGPEVTELLELVAGRVSELAEPGVAALVELCQGVRATVPTGAPPPPLADPLTPREVEVLGYLAMQLTVVEIAARVGVSPNTLKTHLKRAYRKLGVGSRRQAVDAAVRLGLLDRSGARRVHAL